MIDTGITPVKCAWLDCGNFLRDFPEHGRWRYCPEHTYDAHYIDQNIRKFLNRRGFSRREFLKAGGLAGLGLLFEHGDFHSHAYDKLIPNLRASLFSLDLKTVREGCSTLRARLIGETNRDAARLHAFAGEVYRDAGPESILSAKDALQDLLAINYSIEKAWARQHDGFNLARALIMRSQLYLTGGWHSHANTSASAALYLLNRCCLRDPTVKLMQSEGLRLKLRIASMRGAMKTIEQEKKDFLNLVSELGRASVSEKASREIVIWHCAFCTRDLHSSIRERLTHLNDAETLFDRAKKDYASTAVKPVLAELGFLHQEIEIDLIASQLGEAHRGRAALETLHERFIPLLRVHPDFVHFQHLRSLEETFGLNVNFNEAPVIFSPTLPRLYEDAVGIFGARKSNE